jgi:hypothetical protein
MEKAQNALAHLEEISSGYRVEAKNIHLYIRKGIILSRRRRATHFE